MVNYTLGLHVARYLDIRNENGSLVIDDESTVIQTLALTRNVLFSSFNANAINSMDGWKPAAPYTQTLSLNPFTEIYGHRNAVKNDSSSIKIVAYRIFGDLGNLPYAAISASNWSDANPAVTLTANALGNGAFWAQAVWLSLEPYNVPLPNTAFVAYNASGQITFDAALGYVHHIASMTGKINITSQSSNFSIAVKNIAGLGLDVSKLFIVMRGFPRVAQWQWGSSNNFYRVGYRSFVPRLRVTDNVIYVDYGIWMPYDYTGAIAATYNPTYNFSIYYIPSIRSY